MKKTVLNIISSLVISFALVLSLTSCSNNNEETTAGPAYEYTPSGAVSQTGENVLSPENETDSDSVSGGKYTVNNEWKKNYYVSYTYTTKQIPGVVKCTEKKCDGAFIITEENKTKSTQFYKDNGDKIDAYIIIEGKDVHAHSVIEEDNFDSIESFFVKKFTIDPAFAQNKNSIYMADEFVSDRLCCKYIAANYEDGERTGLVYIWIDIQYGFIVKLEAYDTMDKLIESREIIEFKAGEMTSEEVSVDLSQYTFKEA